jgi:glycosyltransferase involved in cell wall biosynthesis
MRIAQIAPIVERLPPKKYGGTERVIYHLTEELVKKGHEVTLFATGDTQTSARLVSVIPRSLREMPNEKDIYGFNVHSLLNMGLAYSMQDQFDVIHDHNAHMGLPTANIAQTPVVMTWHGPYDSDMTRYFSLLRKPHLVSISNSQARLAPTLDFMGTVYNGLPMEHYPFGAKSKGYLLFVGRIDPEKGVHHVMDAAIKLNKKLIIAAKLDDSVSHLKRYYEEEVEPRLKEHPKLLNWIGEVDETERNELMAGALCLLHAVTWPEPFGLTLIEAMACGAPVVAFALGSIPELVQDGVTGYVVQDVDEMVQAVRKLGRIDRAACRAHALKNFSARRMADGYEEVYRRAVGMNSASSEVKRTVSELHQQVSSRISNARYANNTLKR